MVLTIGSYAKIYSSTSNNPFLLLSKFERVCISDKYVSFDVFADMEHEENNIMFKGKVTATITR